MSYKLIYAEDLKVGDRFKYRRSNPVILVNHIERCKVECKACGSKVIEEIQINFPGGLIHLDPKEAVEVLPEVESSPKINKGNPEGW